MQADVIVAPSTIVSGAHDLSNYKFYPRCNATAYRTETTHLHVVFGVQAPVKRPDAGAKTCAHIAVT